MRFTILPSAVKTLMPCVYIMFCAITNPEGDATTDLGDMLVPPTVFTNLSRASFVDTSEADAEFAPEAAIKTATQPTTHEVCFAFEEMSCNMKRWYQRH
jgi:hypothetical protein